MINKIEKNQEMNYLKRTIILLFILSSGMLSANWPGNSSFISHNLFSTEISKNNSATTFLFKKNKESLKHSIAVLSLSSEQLNSEYITGITKNKKDKFNIFEWDFKVKLRLNRNLNIIFTYN